VVYVIGIFDGKDIADQLGPEFHFQQRGVEDFTVVHEDPNYIPGFSSNKVNMHSGSFLLTVNRASRKRSTVFQLLIPEGEVKVSHVGYQNTTVLKF
jgi:hypothetical protein